MFNKTIFIHCWVVKHVSSDVLFLIVFLSCSTEALDLASTMSSEPGSAPKEGAKLDLPDTLPEGRQPDVNNVNLDSEEQPPSKEEHQQTVEVSGASHTHDDETKEAPMIKEQEDKELDGPLLPAVKDSKGRKGKKEAKDNKGKKAKDSKGNNAKDSKEKKKAKESSRTTKKTKHQPSKQKEEQQE